MTNTIRKLLALTLAAVLLLGLAGCTSKDDKLREKLTGDWSCAVDISGLVMDGILSGVGDDTALEAAVRDMTLEGLMLSFDLSIAEDGSFAMGVNSQSITDMVDIAMPPVTKMMRSYLEATLREACAQADISMDTLFQLSGAEDLDSYVKIAMGTDLDSFVAQLLKEAFASARLEELQEQGTVTVKDGVITVASQDYTYPGVYDAAADTLTLQEYVEKLGTSEFVFTRK